LLELACGPDAACLRSLLYGTGRQQPPHLAELYASLFGDSLRSYRYGETYDKADGDIDAHFDMGLLSLIPKSSSSGLMIQPARGTNYVTIEDHMGQDDALIFGGMTLARLSAIPALKHGVFTCGRVRFSAPFFQRVALGRVLPSSRVSPQEEAGCFNRRLREATNDEMRSDGTIVLERRQREWTPPRRLRWSEMDKNKSRSRSVRRLWGQPEPGQGHGDKMERGNGLSGDGFYDVKMENSSAGYYGRVRGGAVSGCRGHCGVDGNRKDANFYQQSRWY